MNDMVFKTSINPLPLQFLAGQRPRPSFDRVIAPTRR